MDNRENVRKESKKAVLIIIPAYNEEKNIVPLLEKLEQPEITQFADVLVVNDASQDETNHVTKKRNHTVITNVFNLGYGSGLQLGYIYAVRKGYSYVIQMDADGQHDVCNLLEIYKELQKRMRMGNCRILSLVQDLWKEVLNIRSHGQRKLHLYGFVQF